MPSLSRSSPLFAVYAAAFTLKLVTGSATSCFFMLRSFADFDFATPCGNTLFNALQFPYFFAAVGVTACAGTIEPAMRIVPTIAAITGPREICIILSPPTTN